MCYRIVNQTEIKANYLFALFALFVLCIYTVVQFRKFRHFIDKRKYLIINCNSLNHPEIKL